MHDPCPNYVELETFLTTGQTAGDLSRHLSSCSACRKIAEEIQINNQLMNRIRQAVSPPSALTEQETDRNLPPADIVRGYRILGEIHRGAQGVVYKAVQESTKRVVALKLALRGGFADSLERARFEREVELVARLQHPGIVAVYDGGVSEEGRPFLAMPLIDGVALDVYWQTRTAAEDGDPPRLLDGILRMMIAVCDAVSHAHVHGIVHRDLKPSNILVDAEGAPRVLDFGLAKLAPAAFTTEREATITQPGGFLGTLAYAAPEQTRGDPRLFDMRTDVYALGVILYKLLTETLPFDVDAPLGEVIRDIVERDPVPPSQRTQPAAAFGVARRRPSLRLNADIDTITLKALAKEKQRRYQSALELARDIQNYLDGRPIDARRDSRWYVIRKTARRYKAAVAAGVLFIAFLVAFSIVMAAMYQRAEREARKARAINLFLQDTLASVRPDGPDRDITLREVLDEAVPWIDIALRDEPEIEGSLRITIGNSYRALRRFDEAEDHLRRALTLRTEVFGPNHSAVAECINALGLLDFDRGRLEEAHRRIQEALTLRTELLGPDHYDVSLSLQNLGNVYRATHRPIEAEEVFRKALRIRQALLGPKHPDVAMVLFNLAGVMESVGEWDEAEALYRQVLAIRECSLAAKHPDLARIHQTLGVFLLDKLQRPVESESHLEKAVNLWNASGLQATGEWLETSSALGAALAAQGRFDEAEPLVLDAYQRLRETRGEDDVRTRQAMARITTLYESWGKPEQVESWGERAGRKPGA